MKPTAKMVIATLFALLIISYFVVSKEPAHLRLGDISTVDVVKLLAPFLLIALFIERAIDVWITAVRGPEKEKLEFEIAKAKHSGRSPVEILSLGDELCKYSAETRKIVWRVGILLGIAVSLTGIRLLEAVLGEDIVPDLPDGQRHWLLLVDTVITGAAIGGGADGIHKISSVFTEYLETNKQKQKVERPTLIASSPRPSSERAAPAASRQSSKIAKLNALGQPAFDVNAGRG